MQRVDESLVQFLTREDLVTCLHLVKMSIRKLQVRQGLASAQDLHHDPP